MDELIEILEDIKPDVDYEGCENLIDGHYLDSPFNHFSYC